jgi:hypothetical protein
MIERALWEQGIGTEAKSRVQKRHEFKAAHGFRKFYKSRAEQVMKPINVEITMGHNMGISESYYRPTEREVTDDYLKAVHLLSVNRDNQILQKELNILTEKTKENEYIINAKLLEKEDSLREMREKYDSEITLLKDAIFDMQQLLKNPEKLSEISKISIPETSQQSK